MSLKLYMDHNVHAAITQGLRARGVDCLTALEDGMASADDQAIVHRASATGRVVFSQDVDFLVITAEWMAHDQPFTGVIYASQMGITIGQAIADLELMAKGLSPADLENHLEHLPLK